MNEKLSLQNIADALAQKAGVSKKAAETFSKAFFETVVEALSKGDESIKVKGLGTFKLVKVDSRESVNVSNGERIVIAGYKKVAFTPEDSVLDVLNGRTEDDNAHPVLSEKEQLTEKEQPSEHVEEMSAFAAISASDTTNGSSAEDDASSDTTNGLSAEDDAASDTTNGSSAKDDAASDISDAANEEIAVESLPDHQEDSVAEPDINTLIEVPEPTFVEQPQDALSGIDLLISTPESVDEVRQQYEEAKAKMEVAVAEARRAHAEKLRLEKLLERLEKNVQPESAHTEEGVEAHTESEDSTDNEEMSVVPATSTRNQEQDSVSNDSKRQEAFHRVVSEQPKMQDTESSSDEQPRKRSWLTAAIVLLLLVLGAMIYMIYRNIEAVEKVPVVAQSMKPIRPVVPKPNKTTAPKENKDSLANPQKADTAKVTVNAPAKLESQPASKVESKPESQKPAEVSKPERPKTHRLQRGESLTKVSQKYYGTKDSVRAILRVNSFRDPDNIPVGVVVRLP